MSDTVRHQQIGGPYRLVVRYDLIEGLLADGYSRCLTFNEQQRTAIPVINQCVITFVPAIDLKPCFQRDQTCRETSLFDEEPDHMLADPFLRCKPDIFTPVSIVNGQFTILLFRDLKMIGRQIQFLNGRRM